MILKSIFQKQVDRPIEGVIKADDEASLRLEIEEYVLTNEIEKRLEAFLDAYNNYEGANGVWISGFFGSGKSHLLKMLALILENRPMDGTTTLELFLKKCDDIPALRGLLLRATSIPSKSILFNIDQKADIISKTQIDALLAVFVKVFDEMCGYYGKQGHIAQFERDLDSRSFYERFKTEYKSISGREWNVGREQALLESQNIASAYAKATESSESLAAGILDKYRNQYKVSIEDFAEQVKAYIEKQPSNFRLNFFVDEVGQYIADNIKLMTNLQTIAESLATKCRGRAWVIVTAQDDMSTVVGEMPGQQSNDFSKIQARFASRMKLTSADVAEVIQKRLLKKNDEGAVLLSDVYHNQVNNFKTLFDFSDNSQTYRNFQDRDHFILSYPFIPYQFSLFQAVIHNLSKHNAFEGKHSSVGERSMLGVFQQVAIQISERNIGQLATFDLMFEGIRTTLKSSIQRAILSSEKNLDDAFAIKLLKVLFLVKYVKEFKSTLRNLCILMIEDFEQDLPTLRKKIEEALNLLERETYIQRNGELYEYLTDAEKDIEKEIKNTEIEISDVSSDLDKIIFEGIIKTNKIRYDENGKDYPYSRKLDDRFQGREYELTIHVVTPLHENFENESVLQMQSMGRDELLIILPPDHRLLTDLKLYRRTDKYIRQNTSIAQQETVKRILKEKAQQNEVRYADIKRSVQQLLAKGKICVSGNALDLNGEDPQTRIIRAFNELVTRTYSNLCMLRGVVYSEKDISKHLTQLHVDGDALSEAEQEVLAFIQGGSRGGVRTTIKTLIDKFEKKPYGWYYAAILCTLAKLCARGKVEARMDGNTLEQEDLERSLTNSHAHSNIVLEPQVEFTAFQVRSLKEFYEDFFDTPPTTTEAKSLGRETSEAFKERIQKLSAIATHVSSYPFLSAINPALKQLKDYTSKSYSWYLTELFLDGKNDVALDVKESIIDPVLKFWEGPQKPIYEEAQKFAKTQESNFIYIPGEESTQLVSVLADPECFKGNKIQQLKSLVDTLQGKISTQLDSEVAQAENSINSLENRLSTMPEFKALSKEQQQQILNPFSEVLKNIKQQKLIAVIRDALRRFEEVEYHRLLSQLASTAKPQPKPTAPAKPGSKSGSGVEVIEAPVEPQVEYVSSRAIRVSFDKAWLADEADVDRYLQSMREALLKEIKEGKRVQI
ncbi:BREX system P-loop protein BrxC [Vampirovibrio sp.]|uniref:BREX system P-loop protein BrxC n=1 Tax=Vampirovibrio sp. TaxID=2717857 RepID=UPI0035934D9A